MVFGTHDDAVGEVEISDLMIDLNYPALKAINSSVKLQLLGATLRGDLGGNNIHNINVNGYSAQSGIEGFPVWIYSVENVLPTQSANNQIKYVLLGNSAPGAICTGITLANVQGELTVRLGRPGESYAGIRKETVNVAGRLCVADDLGACGNPSGDSARTMITTGTEQAAWISFLPVAERGLRLIYELVARYGRGLVRVVSQ